MARMDDHVDYTHEQTYAQTRLPVALASTLVPEAYTSERFFELERERIFARSWVPVAYVSELERPREAVVARVAGRSVVIVRDDGGDLNAFHNVCRHRGSKLLADDCRKIRGSRIRCPYHSWTYDLRGNCVGTPLFEGSGIPEEQQPAFDMSGAVGFDRADFGLHPVRVETWGFLVFVSLDPDAPP